MVAVYYSCKPARIEDIFTVGEPLLYKDNSDNNEQVTGLWVEAVLGYKPCKDNGGQVFATIVPTFIPRKFEIDQFACGYPLAIKKWSEAEAIRCKRVFDKYVKEHCGGDAAKVVFCCEKEFNECKEMKPVVQEAIEERQRLWQNYKEGDPVIGTVVVSGQKVNGGRNKVNKVDEDEERERDAVEADPGFEQGSERRKKEKATPNKNNNLAAKPGRDGKRHRAFIDSDSDSDEKEVKSVAPVVTSSGRVVKKRKMTDTEELVVLDSDSDMEMDVPKKKKKKRPSAVVGVKSSGGPSKGIASSQAPKVVDVAEMDKNKKKKLVAPAVVVNPTPTGGQGRSRKSIDKATKVADVAEMDKNKKKLLAPTVVANPTGGQGRSRRTIDKGAEKPDSTADKESDEMEMENKKKAVVVTTLSGRVSRPPVTLDYEKNVKKTPKLPRTVKAKPVSLKKHIPIPYVMTPDEAELHNYKKKLKEMKEKWEKERIESELRIDAEKRKLRDEKMKMSLTNEELRRRLAQVAAGGPCNTEPIRLVKVALDLDKTIIIHDTVDVHEYILDDEEADGEESEGEERGEDDESEERGEDDESEERGEDDESDERGDDDERDERGDDDERDERGDDDERDERGDDDERDERDGEEEEEDMNPMWQQMQNPVEQDYEEIEEIEEGAEMAEMIAWHNDDDVFAQEQHQNAVDDMTGEVEEVQINKFDDELFEMPTSLLPPFRIGSDVLENVRDWRRQTSASVERETVGHEDTETTEYEYSERVEVNEEGGEIVVID